MKRPLDTNASSASAGSAQAAEAIAAAPLPPDPMRETGSLRRLGRDALFYGAGMVLSRLVSFLLLPLYTRFLTPADFGLLQMLQMILDVVAIAVSAGTTAGVLRFYYKADSEDERNRIVVTALYLLLGLNLLGAAVLVPLAPLVWQLALRSAGSPELIVLAAANFVLEACITVPLLLMQARRRAALYAAVTLAKLILGLALNVWFVVGFDRGVGGILLANLVANVLTGGLLLTWMLRQTGVRPSAGAARDLRRFGVPYQIVTAGTFLLTFGDRAFLQAYHGLAAVGLYGLAYQFGFMLVSLTSAPFFRAWTPQRLQLSVTLGRAARDARYNQAFRYLNVIVVSAAASMALFAWPLVALMSAPAFRPAAALVPLILLAFVVQIWTDVVSLGIEVSEQTRFASYATWVSVAAVLALYAALIPSLGGLGAALATLGGNLVRFGCTLYWAQRQWPVDWDWGQPLKLTTVTAAIVGVAVSVQPPSWIGQVAIAAGCLLLYALVVWFAVLSRGERAQLAAVVRAPRAAFASMTAT